MKTVWFFCAVATLALAGCRGKYIRETSAEKIEVTPERLKRGEYLVNQVSSCGACHTSRERGDILMETERTDAFLAGGNVYMNSGHRVFIPNITSDMETGVGKWTDDELMRAIRDGVNRDGKFMMPMMPFGSYRNYCDEDARSIVAYIRSVPPVKIPRPRMDNALGFMGTILFNVVGVQMQEPVKAVAAPDKKDKVNYGKYVMSVAACSECHSMGEKGPYGPETDKYLGGSEVAWDQAQLGKVYARNLTPDMETGLGKYTPEQIKQAIRTGNRLDGKRMAPPMSVMIPHVSGMSDEDLDALVSYLKTVKPVKHAVPERVLTAEVKKQVGET